MHLSFPVMHFAICLYRSKIFCFPPLRFIPPPTPRDPHIATPTQGEGRAHLHPQSCRNPIGRAGKVKLGSPASLAVTAPSLPCQKAEGKPKFK